MKAKPGGNGSSKFPVHQQDMGGWVRVYTDKTAHLQRDPPQITSFLHQLERVGYSIRHLNYDGDIVPTDAATIVANPQEHWMLWLLRG